MGVQPKGTNMTTANQNAKRLAPRIMVVSTLDDAALCRRCDGLGNLAWTCRARGWNRKLQQTLADLRTTLAELTRRIERENA